MFLYIFDFAFEMNIFILLYSYSVHAWNRTIM